MEKVTLDGSTAEGLWEVFNALGKGWQISSGMNCVCFDSNDANEMKEAYKFPREIFDALKDLNLVQYGEPEEMDFSSKQTTAQTLGSLFSISEHGKTLYADVSILGESDIKSKFYELAGVEVE